jgi:hypothetical protein
MALLQKETQENFLPDLNLKKLYLIKILTLLRLSLYGFYATGSSYSTKFSRNNLVALAGKRYLNG